MQSDPKKSSNNESNNESNDFLISCSEIKALLKKGKSSGYITHEQLNKALPDGE